MTFDPERKEPVKIVNDNQQTQRVQNRADDTTNDAAPIKVTLYTVDNAIIKYMQACAFCNVFFIVFQFILLSKLESFVFVIQQVPCDLANRYILYQQFLIVW